MQNLLCSKTADAYRNISPGTESGGLPYTTDLVKFDENVEAWNHATNVHHWISQDGGQWVIEFNTEHIHVKTTVQTFPKTDVGMR